MSCFIFHPTKEPIGSSKNIKHTFVKKLKELFSYIKLAKIGLSVLKSFLPQTNLNKLIQLILNLFFLF